MARRVTLPGNRGAVYATDMPVTAETFRRLALEDDDQKWELVCGRLIQRPAMSFPHNSLSFELAYDLRNQLDRALFHVRSQAGHVQTPAGGYRIPDVAVILVASAARYRGTKLLEEYGEPLPFVAEVWSPSTGDFNVETKFPEYRARGDAVIWRIHPFERTVTAWVRRADGGYDERALPLGRVAIESLSGVTIDLEALFEFV